jgi:hypothetical protein
MSKLKSSVVDLFDLPRTEREIFLHLSRKGPADAKVLAHALGCEFGVIQDALKALLRKGHVRQRSDSQYEEVLGHVTHRTTLPAQLWPALLAADRHYSEQEIATLRTVIPMLQFARAKLSEFTDHGPGHALRVKSFATQLSYIQGLSSAERHLLRAGALFHDIGNVVSRERHNIVSQETVEKLTADGELPFSSKEAEIVGLLCRWHRREYNSARIDKLNNEVIRTGLLASILRVADAMDIDHRRSDYGEKFWKVLEFFFRDQIHHWTSLEQILGVRIHCTPAIYLQVFTQGQVSDNVQIDMLSGDLSSTPLDWLIKKIDVNTPYVPDEVEATVDGSALLVFPFEAHSLIMAALSRKHLAVAGSTVELLCYPDTVDGSTWLWCDTLPEIDVEGFVRLVVIGDRPDSSITPQLLQTVRQWQESNVTISILNRHEGNWSRLPKLLDLGIEVILGGDWAYFWCDVPSEVDLMWGRIGSLCTRDPTQSTVGVTDEERSVTHGLLNVIYSAIARPPVSDTTGWIEKAEPILDRIAANDRAYFNDQASGFLETYTKATTPGRIEGRVVVFDQAPAQIPQAFYWIMETAIEEQDRVPERSIHYNVPYAIANWQDGDEAEVLAISHWREEEAIPIRLLYPSQLGPVPQGNESSLRVRMPVKRAGHVVQALLEACCRS